MKINTFQELSTHGKKFVSKMNQNNIPKDLQRAMLKAYIAGYITRNRYNIRLTEEQITELVG